MRRYTIIKLQNIKTLLIQDDLRNVIEEMESIAEKNLNLNGLNQYEISSWCKDGCEGLHNMNYWKYGDYYGVGPGAHSKITKEDGVYRGIKLKKLNSYNKIYAGVGPCIGKKSYEVDSKFYKKFVYASVG